MWNRHLLRGKEVNKKQQNSKKSTAAGDSDGSDYIGKHDTSHDSDNIDDGEDSV